MTTGAMKKKVHQYLDEADEHLLNIIYGIIKVYKEEESKESLLTKEQKIELDKTLLEHKAGKLKYHTIDSAKRLVNKK